MTRPNFENAKAYVLKRLENELPPRLIYHTLAHTQEEVVPAVEQLAAAEGVNGEDLLLLRTAAYFHDLGYIRDSQPHEYNSIQIAKEVLPGFGYSEAQIATIEGIILATKLPQSPHNLLEEIMADADLDGLGCDNFLERGLNLRAEQERAGRRVSDREWYLNQIHFLEDHHYWTRTARLWREPRKQENIRMLKGLLDSLSPQ